MRTMHWRRADVDALSVEQRGALLWLLDAERIVERLPQPTAEYADPAAVRTQVDLALFGLPEMPDGD